MSGFRSSWSINPSDSDKPKMLSSRVLGSVRNCSAKVPEWRFWHQNWPFLVLKPLILALFSSEVLRTLVLDLQGSG